MNGMQIWALPSTLLLERSDWRLVRFNAEEKAAGMVLVRGWSERREVRVFLQSGW